MATFRAYAKVLEPDDPTMRIYEAGLRTCPGEPGMPLAEVLRRSGGACQTGHADILREQLDGAIGMTARAGSLVEDNSELWKARRATIEQAARAADPANAPS